MTAHVEGPEAAFRRLRRALWRRRWQRLDVRLRIEISAIALLVAAFVLWRARNPLDHARRVGGPGSTGLMALEWLVGLALVGGSLAGVRHLRALKRGPAGPPWLPLPAPPHRLARHLSAESRAHALWITPLAAGVLAATLGLVPWVWTLGLAAVFVGSLLESARLACAIALRAAGHGGADRAGATAIERALIASRPTIRTRRVGAAGWHAPSPTLALWRKDLLLSWRPTGARRRLLPAPLFLGLAIASWFAPIEPALAHFAAFALSLAAAGAVGEWLIALAGEDPFPLLRALPVSGAHVWASRAAWAVIAAATVVVAHLIAARVLSPEAHQLFLIWLGGATLLIAVLGVNYGITLYPRVDLAQRLYAIALGFTIAASLMITLMGWLVLIAAVVHSSLKLRHWSRRGEAT